MGSKLNFLREYISQPDSIGAIAPSGRVLASRMLDGIHLEESAVVVELGPGSGAFTARIIDRISPGARFLAIEKNPTFVHELRQHFSDVEIIEGSASSLNSILAEKGIEEVNTVVSGLPWASFPDQLQEQILVAISQVLAGGGHFVTFAYGGIHLFPRARAFRQRLDRLFSDVKRTPLAWSNLPPAFAYHCRM
ncbi:MAG: rRNA adenine N-6-methyltransferase family protein [Planctomycetota bacterium]|nr:rRNA adenine N-6-methyltransferase family protein [Planctomycetota bacterium]